MITLDLTPLQIARNERARKAWLRRAARERDRQLTVELAALYGHEKERVTSTP